MIEIENPRTVISKCKRLLAASLNSSYFDFVKEAGMGHRLAGDGQANALAGTIRYPVLPLRTDADMPFWLAVDLTFFKDAEGSKISAISLVFFEGERSDDDKTPLIRAEWDYFREGNAQPHWHVYSAQKRSAADLEAEFFQEMEIQEFGEPTDEPANTLNRLALEKFHFPMLGTWHLDLDASVEVQFDEESVCRWIGGCVSYTRKQLAI